MKKQRTRGSDDYEILLSLYQKLATYVIEFQCIMDYDLCENR